MHLPLIVGAKSKAESLPVYLRAGSPLPKYMYRVHLIIKSRFAGTKIPSL
jgi:hypothetical protein